MVIIYAAYYKNAYYSIFLLSHDSGHDSIHHSPVHGSFFFLLKMCDEMNSNEMHITIMVDVWFE
jgi:hypothetical protein